MIIIYLGILSPICSSDLPTGECEQHSISPILVLLQVGFTRLSQSPGKRWALTSPFHPYQVNLAVIFCCTFLRITPTRRYLAPCSMELRLSSRSLRCPRLSGLLNFTLYYHTKKIMSISNIKVLFLLIQKTILKNFQMSILNI